MISEQISHSIVGAKESVFYQDFGNAGRMLILATLVVLVPIIENHLYEVLVVDDGRYP